MNNQALYQSHSVYSVFEFKGKDRAQLAKDVAEANQLLEAIYGAPTGTVPLG